MPLRVNVDTSGMDRKILEYATVAKKSMKEVLIQEGRILAVALAKYTQPFGFDDKARNKGEGAIIRDYRRVYPALAAQFILNKVQFKARPKDKEAASIRMAAYVQAGNTTAIMKMLGDMKIATQGQKADPKFHADRWRNGVLKGGVAQIVPDQKTVEQLIEQAKAIAGFAKSGWATCASKLGGTRGGNKSENIPPWVTRHKAPGQVIDNTDAEKPNLTLINQVNYTAQVLSQSAIRQAVQERATRIQLSIDRAIKYGVKDK